MVGVIIQGELYQRTSGVYIMQNDVVVGGGMAAGEKMKNEDLRGKPKKGKGKTGENCIYNGVKGLKT